MSQRPAPQGAATSLVSLKSLVGFGLALGMMALAASGGIKASPSRQNPGNWLWWKLQKKPNFTPPNQVFAAAWPVLWGLSSWSFMRVWRQPASDQRRLAIASYAVHGGLNAMWSPLFFGQHKKTAALAVVSGDLAASGTYLLAASKVDRLSATLAAPLVAWLGFASLLNLEVVRMNRR